MEKIPREIYKDLIGKPYLFQGRGPKEYDCLGLCYEIYSRLGVLMPHHASVLDKKLRAAALEEGKHMFVRLDGPEPGCIVGMRMAGIVNHVGIMLDEKSFIHAKLNVSVCIEKINDLKYKNKVEGFYRFIGEIDE
jgi:cell wall-associated NlpC family hydrolase